ncbi:MAG: divergent polysaccharide deacetylase family protein [Alphaproteobacteria bacterium]|nr:divergent polysaccharide deacetylase family protein [Alphaproteobacteria bacterium]
MKKSFKKKLNRAFWAIFALGVLWVAFAPHRHVTLPPGPPPSVTVPVEQPPLGGEEQSQQTTPPPEAGITVPTAPEETPPPPPPPSPPVAEGVKPKIAIVIDDVGVDLKGSERAIHLASPITLSFLPYAVRLKEEAKEARDAGHEMLLHMPMEPLGHEDPGPGALLVDLPMRDLQQRFENALASFTGFDGVNNHMGSKFTAYADGMSMVMDELSQRHLFYLDSRTSAQSVGKQIAEEKGLPTISRDVFLDDVQSPELIRKQLAETERIARRKGYAVAIGHPHAATMDVMETWIPDAQARGFELVPVHDLVKE